MEKVKSVLAVALDLLKKYWKILVAILVVIVIIILGVNLFSGKAKANRAVKSYISAINSQKTEKVMKKIDVQGYVAYKTVNNDDDLKWSDYSDEYDDVDEDDTEDKTETIEDGFDSLFDVMSDYSSYKIKVKKISETKKLSKNLYKVKAKIQITYKDDGDKDTETNTVTFYVYKGKVIYDESFMYVVASGYASLLDLAD